MSNNCIHCDSPLTRLNSSRDHVPSKFLLRKPYPENIPTLRICKSCNLGFSADEEYLGAFLGMVLTADPAVTKPHHLERMIESNWRIEESLLNAIRLEKSGSKSVPYLVPDSERLQKVIGKNARGHLYLKNTGFEPNMHPKVVVASLDSIPDYLWPRFLPSIDSWTTVQSGVYRFHISTETAPTVRVLIWEYLYAEVTFKFEPT